MNTRYTLVPPLRLLLLIASLQLGVCSPVFAAGVDLFMVIHPDRSHYTLQQTISPAPGSVTLGLPARSNHTDIVFAGADHESLEKQYTDDSTNIVLEAGSVIVRHTGKLEELLVPRDDGMMEFMLQTVMMNVEFSGDSPIRQSARIRLPAGLEFVSRKNQPYNSAEARHHRKLQVVTSGKHPLRVPIRFRLLDADADGIVDPEDSCSDSAEGALVDARGCEPDADADGVSDLVDLCPGSSSAASVDKQGCEPDADGDGLVDRFDQCDDTPAGNPINENGCDLDSDQDAVVDTLDQCPDSAPGEPVNSDGCSLDFDKDGVANFRDLCSGTDFGRAVDASGCEPDKDRDGIIDRLDVCLQTPRDTTVDSSGCALDSDADSIPDYRDLCPAVAENVDSFGCIKASESTAIVLAEVSFSGPGAALNAASRQVLDRVARAVNFHQPQTFELSGHSAEAENSKLNQEVSMARATAALQYLMVRGVPPNQVIARGYGDAKILEPTDAAEKPALTQRLELRRLPATK